MAYIEPLDLKTWFMNVFSGSPDIFLVMALLAITGMAAYFRMTFIATILVVGLFIALFTQEVSSALLIAMVVFGLLFFIYKFIKTYIQ